jgi:transcriptional regulator with XRE-family HTH domain
VQSIIRGMGRRTKKDTRLLTSFGTFLRRAREDKSIESQKDAAEKLDEQGYRASQSLIAHLEAGRNTNPDEELLQRLAAIYDRSFDEILLQFILDKYVSRRPSFSQELWRTLEILLKKTRNVGRAECDIAHQLRATEMLMAAEALDIDGLAQWQKNFPNLTEYWVVAVNSIFKFIKKYRFYPLF